MFVFVVVVVVLAVYMHAISFLGATALSGVGFGEATRRSWLDNVLCTGSEKALMDCTANSSESTCSHAGVRCLPGICSVMYPWT